MAERAPGLKALIRSNWQKAKPARDMAQEALARIEAERNRRLVGRLLEKLHAMSGHLDAALGEAKERRRGLDFDDLLLETRKLLAENLTVRRKLKERFKVILVDEFQDTNRL